MQIETLFFNYIHSQRATARLKQSTISTYYGIFERYIEPFFRGILEISEQDITDFTKILLFKLSRKTVNDILTLFSAILRYNRIDIEVYKPTFYIPDADILSLQDWERLESYCISHLDFFTFGVLLALYTGIRPGELCAGRKRNADLITRAFHVTDTMQRIKNLDPNVTKKTKVIIDTPKSKQAVRTIPLIDDLVLIAHNLYQGIPTDAFLLTGNSKYIEVRSYEQKLNRIYEAVGIQGKNAYSIRHAFATYYYQNTKDIKTLSELLGHKDIKTTYRYIGTDETAKRQGVNSLARIKK